MHTGRIALISTLAALALSACGKDPVAPPSPAVDPIASPTSLSKITVTGSAQYNAKITISGGAAVSPAQIIADPFTARFSAVVTLTHNATNTLTFTATDGGGRTSAPTTVAVQQSDNFAVSIQNLLVNGIPCAPGGVPPSCAASSGDLIDFDLVANSTVAVSEVQYTAFFSTAGGAGTLRSQRVLVAPNSPLPYVQHFTFGVPGGTLLETVPLEGLSIDSLGNRSTSPALSLRVNSITSFGRAVAPVAVGRLVNAPNDIAFDASGNLFIANDGSGNLLKLAAGGTTPLIFSGYGARSNFAITDGPGNLYVSDNGGNVFRIAPDGTVSNYISFGGGLTAEGLTTNPPTFAKGLATVGAAVAGDTVTVGSKTYEFRAGGTGCTTPGSVCVDLNAPNKTQALATAVQANSVEANATFDAGSGKAVISAKALGSAGNAINFSTSNALAITLSPTGGKLGEGHDEDLFVGQMGGADLNIYRFPETLTGAPGAGANNGSFAVATQQLGVAVRDLTTASSPNLRDLYLYFIDQTATKTLRAYHAVDSAAPLSVFAITPGGGGGDLYDIVRLANNCLLVSDQKGKIYSIDTRNPTTTAPTVATIASGFAAPRGLAVFGGDLYVADNTFNAIVRISALPGAACF